MAQTKAQLVDYGTAVASSVPTNGPYLAAANTVAVATSGAGRLFIDGSGRIGVGTSTPQLSIGAVGGNVLHLAGAGTTGIRVQNTSGNSVDIYAGSDGFINQSGSGSLNLQLAGSTKATLTSTGLGIGTASPGGLLHCALGTSPSPSTGWTTSTAVFGAGGTTGSAFGIAHDTTNGTRLYSIEPGVAWRPIEMLCNGLIFKSTNNSEAARFDTSGRLLVGTSSASGNNYLQIQGDAAGSSNPGGIFLRRGLANASIGANNTLGTINFGNQDGGIGAVIEALGDAQWGSNDYPGRLTFSTTADGASSPTERMRINSIGNLIQGTVVSTNGVGYNTTNSGVEIGGGAVSHQVPNNSSSGAYFEAFFRGSSLIGSITQSGTTTVQFNTSSDYRLKENVVPVEDGIERLMQLKPSRFNFISEPDRIVDGFLAHEAQAVVPECVSGEKDAVDDNGNPKYQGIDHSKLVPLLTAALQEAIGEIESLRARLDAANL